MTPPIEDATPEDVEDFWFNQRYDDLSFHLESLRESINQAIIDISTDSYTAETLEFLDSLTNDKEKCMEAMRAMLPHPVIGPALIWMNRRDIL